MKGENKLEGASNYRVCKKMIDLILENNKVLNFVQGKIKKPTHEASETKKTEFKETRILAMNLIVDGVKDNLIPYISNIDSAQEMYEDLSRLFTIKNIGQITSLKNELGTIKIIKDETVSFYCIRISRIRDELQAIDEVDPKKSS